VLDKYGRSAVAIQLLDAALARDPESADAQNNLAWMLLTAKDAGARDAGKALALARRATAKKLPDEKLAMYLDTLAKAEFQNGLLPQALEHQEKAVKLALDTSSSQTDELLKNLDEIKKAAAPK
jgi:tetratricopeptide (TPR) repeat protein